LVAGRLLLICRIIVERYLPVMIRFILIERYQLIAGRRLVISRMRAEALPPVIMYDIVIEQYQLVRQRLLICGVIVARDLLRRSLVPVAGLATMLGSRVRSRVVGVLLA
jgi:hypothetical protein